MTRPKLMIYKHGCSWNNWVVDFCHIMMAIIMTALIGMIGDNTLVPCKNERFYSKYGEFSYKIQTVPKVKIKNFLWHPTADYISQIFSQFFSRTLPSRVTHECMRGFCLGGGGTKQYLWHNTNEKCEFALTHPPTIVMQGGASISYTQHLRHVPFESIGAIQNGPLKTKGHLAWLYVSVCTIFR